MAPAGKSQEALVPERNRDGNARALVRAHRDRGLLERAEDDRAGRPEDRDVAAKPRLHGGVEQV